MAVYEVHAGDSLWEIANHFHVPVAKLIQANPQISNPDLICIGDRIHIPSASTATPSIDIGSQVALLRSGLAGILHSGPTHSEKAGSTKNAAVAGAKAGVGSGVPAAKKKSNSQGGSGSAGNKKTPPWLTLAYQEYIAWQRKTDSSTYLNNQEWMQDQILKYCRAGGLPQINEWCSAFANWVIQHSLGKPHGNGFVQGTRHGLAASWASWKGGKQVAPRRGAIALRRGWSESWNDYAHVGFLMDWQNEPTEETVYCNYSQQYLRVYKNVQCEFLGGNQGSRYGYQEWGPSAVTRSWQSAIHGFVFIWPNWLP